MLMDGFPWRLCNVTTCGQLPAQQGKYVPSFLLPSFLPSFLPSVCGYPPYHRLHSPIRFHILFKGSFSVLLFVTADVPRFQARSTTETHPSPSKVNQTTPPLSALRSSATSSSNPAIASSPAPKPSNSASNFLFLAGLEAPCRGSDEEVVP